jgi:hypothetical protein
MNRHSEKLDLKQLLDKSDYVDNTKHIRKVKHSVLIRDDIRKIDILKLNSSTTESIDQFMEKCRTECRFLYDNYTDIFNKLLKDEIDLSIMTQLLTILKMIEDEKIDQEQGSILVGKILKELYIDSALKRSDNLDKEQPLEIDGKNQIEAKSISWKQYKLSK